MLVVFTMSNLAAKMKSIVQNNLGITDPTLVFCNLNATLCASHLKIEWFFSSNLPPCSLIGCILQKLLSPYISVSGH